MNQQYYAEFSLLRLCHQQAFSLHAVFDTSRLLRFQAVTWRQYARPNELRRPRYLAFNQPQWCSCVPPLCIGAARIMPATHTPATSVRGMSSKNRKKFFFDVNHAI